MLRRARQRRGRCWVGWCSGAEQSDREEAARDGLLVLPHPSGRIVGGGGAAAGISRAAGRRVGIVGRLTLVTLGCYVGGLSLLPLLPLGR
ncbi:MAG: hypothetical protein ABI333_18450 [bacterium]